MTKNQAIGTDYFPFDVELHDRRKHERYAFNTYCKLSIPNAGNFLLGETHNISLSGMKVSCNTKLENIPMYINVGIPLPDESNLEIKGYVNSLPDVLNGKYVYEIKFTPFSEDQIISIRTLLSMLGTRVDRRYWGRINKGMGIDTSNRKLIQHKTKVFNYSERRKKMRRLIDQKFVGNNKRNGDRRKKDRRVLKEKIQHVNWVIKDSLTSSTEKLLQFYRRANFLYRTKLDFILPIKDEVLDTVGKLLVCNNNTCKYIFVTDGDEIIGSVMAVQYTNDTWIMQHLVVLPGHNLLVKDLITEILSWSIRNKDMNYFMSYFQDKTKWAFKTYHDGLNKFGGKHVAIESYDYMYKPIGKVTHEIVRYDVYELDKEDYMYIYPRLLQMGNEVVLHADGLKEKSFRLDFVASNYKKIGIHRDRKYFVAKDTNGRILGFCYTNLSTYGINLSLLLNTFRIFIFDDDRKEEIYAALIQKINQVLMLCGKTYSIGLVNPSDKIFFKKLGYVCLRTYSCCVYSKDENLFQKSLDFIISGRKYGKASIE